MDPAWERDGLIVLRGFLPDDLIEEYTAARGTQPLAWQHPTPYMHEPALRALCCWSTLTVVLTELLGEPPLLHLTLTDFRSTERAWHQDGYLNPPHVGDSYLAVWMALGDIHEDAGPFEYVAGSSSWPERLSGKDARQMATAEQRAHPDWWRLWPTWTQEMVAQHWEDQIRRRNAKISQFYPATKGDVLIWSPWLVHRGARPRDRGLMRPALISHYSGVDHRPDMPDRAQHPGGAMYALIDTCTDLDRTG